MNTLEVLSRNPLYRRIGLAAILLFMLIVDPLVDVFVQPEIPFVNFEHFLVGLITGLIGFFFMGLTAYLVRRLTKAELEKEALVRHFDYLSKYANDIVVLADENWQIIEVNDKALSTYGYTREEICALKPHLLRAADEQKRPDLQLEHVCLENGLIFETRHQRKDGSTFPAEVSARSYEHAGRKFFQNIIRDITERKMAEAAIQLHRDQLRSLAARAEKLVEEERKTLAREIHDQLGQELTAIKMNVAVLASRLAHDEALSEKIRYIRQLVDTSIHTVRKISMTLRPGVLDELGLGAAIQWQVKEFEKQYGIRCRYTDKTGAVTIKDGAANAVFRIVQESLTNIARHAHAAHVNVEFGVRGADICLIVEDDGKGIDMGRLQSNATLGIIGMKERAYLLGGTVAIDRLPASGTRVTASIPGAVQ